MTHNLRSSSFVESLGRIVYEKDKFYSSLEVLIDFGVDGIGVIKERARIGIAEKNISVGLGADLVQPENFVNLGTYCLVRF